MDTKPLGQNRPAPQANWHDRSFFGLHYDLHAGLKDTALGAELTHEHLKAELQKVRPDFVQCDCKGHPGLTSWPTEVGTPSPGIVKDALRIHRDVTRELGIPLVMHYSGVYDAQAVELHPDWSQVDAGGDPSGTNGGIKGATCNLSPYTSELMIPQMLELIDKYDVDGFWVDGENWATGACYCERCRAEFTRRTGITEIPLETEDQHWDQWAAFHRAIFEEHVQLYTRAVHERKPGCLVCSNWMYTVSQPDPMTAEVDYLSGDFSWKWSVATALLEGRLMDGRRRERAGLSWDLMAWAFSTGEDQMGGWTFKHTPGLCQEAAAVIGLGGSFLMYNTPQRNGHLTAWHQDTMAEVERFIRARQPWCQDTVSASRTAILHNAADYYPSSGKVLMAAWTSAQSPVTGALHALLENHLSVDVLTAPTLEAALSDYSLVVIAEQTQLPDSLVAALQAWVEKGGRLLLSGGAAVAKLSGLAGVEVSEEEKPGFHFLEVDGQVTTNKGPWQPVQLRGATMLHRVLEGQDPLFNAQVMAASTVNSVGKGKVAAVPGPLFAYFAKTHYPRTRKLVGEIVAALQPELGVSVEAPARVHLMLRQKGEQLIAHLFNTGTGHPLSPQNVLVEDVPHTGPVTLRFERAQAPRAVYLAPAMEGLTWSYRDGVLTVTVASIGILDSVVVE